MKFAGKLLDFKKIIMIKVFQPYDRNMFSHIIIPRSKSSGGHIQHEETIQTDHTNFLQSKEEQ